VHRGKGEGAPVGENRRCSPTTSHAPLLGQHSVEVLAEAGYTGAEIERLLADGVTATA
jgi:crotonobetainyl-CoA:carnitine CoA-transferase CaiB-like acyl-CoA transferase